MKILRASFLVDFLCLQVTCGYTVTMMISARIQPPKTTVIRRRTTLVSGFSHPHTYWLDVRVLFLASAGVFLCVNNGSSEKPSCFNSNMYNVN